MERVKQESECCCCFNKENLSSMLEPYDYEEKCEIYSTLIAECFQIELNSYIQEIQGNLCLICKNCVFRLREAITFRSEIQIAYDRLQDIYESYVKDGRLDFSTEHSDIVDTKENILNPDVSNLSKHCKIQSFKQESECCCCYDKENLSSMLEPYDYEEKSEIYSTMIAGCFQIELNLQIQEHHKNLCLICKNCVFRLREAIMFRSQIQIAYDRLQDICESYVKDGRLGFSTERSDIVDTKKNIILNPDLSDLSKYCKIDNDEYVPIECSNIAETKENIVKLEVSECHSTGVDSVASFSNEKAKKVKPSKIVIENKMKDITSNSSKDQASLRTDVNRSRKCEFCEKVLCSKIGLKRHVELLHSNPQNFKCEFCDIVLKSKYLFLKHMNVHSNPQKITCKYCDKTFSTTSSLLHHEKMHLDNINFICDYCEEEFSLKDNLQTHIMKHLYDNDEYVPIDCSDIVDTKENIVKLEFSECDSTGVDSAASFSNENELKVKPLKIVLENKIKDKTINSTKDQASLRTDVKPKFEFCDTVLSTKVAPKRHVESHFNPQKYKCEFCKIFLKSEYMLLKHMKTHSNTQKYTCKYCDKTFSSIRFLLSHENIHFDNKNFICDYCDKEFSLKVNLQYHIMKHLHDNDEYVPNDCSDIVDTKENIVKLEISEYHSTGVDSATSFSNENELKVKPLKIVIENMIKDKTINSTKDQASLRTDAKGHACALCEKKFASRVGLLQHRKLHADPKKFTCKYCDKLLTSTNHLLRHEKLVHMNIKDLICNYCNKEFGYKTSLIRHILTHMNGSPTKKRSKDKPALRSNVKSHKCEICKKVLTSSSLLLKHHMKIHSKPRKYKCTYCDKILSSPFHLSSHEKFHMNIQNFICDYCNKEFGNKYTLEKHIRTHLYGNSTKERFKDHSSLNSNVKSRKCEFCDKILTSNSLFSEHMKIHYKPLEDVPFEQAVKLLF